VIHGIPDAGNILDQSQDIGGGVGELSMRIVLPRREDLPAVSDEDWEEYIEGMVRRLREGDEELYLQLAKVVIRSIGFTQEDDITDYDAEDLIKYFSERANETFTGKMVILVKAPLRRGHYVAVPVLVEMTGRELVEALKRRAHRRRPPKRTAWISLNREKGKVIIGTI